MLRIAAATAVTMIALASVLYLRVQSTTPYWDRVRYQHWRYSEEMTRFADAFLDRSADFNWIALVEGNVEAGADRQVRVELDNGTKEQFRALMLEADLYWLGGVSPPDGQTAFVDYGGGWRWDRDFSVGLSYARNGQDPRAICDGEYKETDAGGCSILLDENWAYDLIWFVKGYEFPDPDSERRITIP